MHQPTKHAASNVYLTVLKQWQVKIFSATICLCLQDNEKFDILEKFLHALNYKAYNYKESGNRKDSRQYVKKCKIHWTSEGE